MATSKPTATWDAVIAAGVEAQRLVPGSIAVGGSAAALYAHHRISQDTDHLLADLVSHFQEVRDALEHDSRWRTARVQPPVLILGNIGGVEVGFRQARRRSVIQTSVMQTASGPIVVPTLDEMIGMKGYMAYSRNATRDFLDLAALMSLAGDDASLAALLQSNERYGHLQQTSVVLGIAGCLSDPRPFDLESVDLGNYKGLVPEWRDWSRVVRVCQTIGRKLTDRLVLDR